MKHFFVVFGLLCLAACDDDGAPFDPNLSGGQSPDQDASSPPGESSTGRPSGARVRVFNAYAPLNGEPGPVDLFPQSWIQEGATPLKTVPYGTMTDFFDPTVQDDAGDMFLSVYAAGTAGNGSQLITKTETLKGTEVITYFVFTAPTAQESGRRFGGIQPFFHRASDDPVFGTPIPAGKAVITMTAVGLDEVLTSHDPLYVGTGAGCLMGVRDEQSTAVSITPGSTGATYVVDPGTFSGAIHADPTCATAPVASNVPLEIKADQSSAMLVYAPKDGDVRAVFVPLEPTMP